MGKEERLQMSQAPKNKRKEFEMDIENLEGKNKIGRIYQPCPSVYHILEDRIIRKIEWLLANYLCLQLLQAILHNHHFVNTRGGRKLFSSQQADVYHVLVDRIKRNVELLPANSQCANHLSYSSFVNTQDWWKLLSSYQAKANVNKQAFHWLIWHELQVSSLMQKNALHTSNTFWHVTFWNLYWQSWML